MRIQWILQPTAVQVRIRKCHDECHNDIGGQQLNESKAAVNGSEHMNAFGVKST